MLQKKRWRKVIMLCLVVVSIAGFGLLLYSRFNQGHGQPVSKNAPDGRQQSQTELLQLTDKIELSQTDLIEIAPSETVTSAEAALPESAAPAYKSSCEKLKDLYTSEYSTKVEAENDRYKTNQQAIINQYSKLGLSFSSKQKLAQAQDTRRHDTVLKQLSVQLQKQLKGISC